MIAIILFIALFVFSLWFTGFIAKALGAERPGMLWVFLVFVILVVIQVLLGLTPLVQHPVILLIGLILISSFVYAKVLQMKLLGGFLTMLVSSIVSVLLFAVIGIVAGVSLPAYQDYVQRVKMAEGSFSADEITLDTVGLAAEAVCQCETDKQCIGDKSREFGQMMGMHAHNRLSPTDNVKIQRYTERVLICTLKPGAYDSSKAVIQPKKKYSASPVFDDAQPSAEHQPFVDDIISSDLYQSDPQSSDNTDIEKENAAVASTPDTATIQTPSYQPVSAKNAKEHIGRPARVLRKSGKKMEGKIASVNNGKLMIEQRRYGGIFSFPLKFSDVKQLEVYY